MVRVLQGVAYPASLVTKPLIELCLYEEFEEPCCYKSHEGYDEATGGHLVGDVGLEEMVAVSHQSRYATNTDISWSGVGWGGRRE